VSSNVIYDPWLSEPVGEEVKPSELPWLYMIIPVVIIVVLAGAVLGIKRRKRKTPPLAQLPYTPPPMPLQPPVSYEQPPPPPEQQVQELQLVPQPPPSKITIQCPHCKATGMIDPSFHGKLRCPACHIVFEV